MVFQSKEELFHDIPVEKAVYSSRTYPRSEESFVKFYYEEALPDADAAAENKISYNIKDREERQKYCRNYFPGCLRAKIDKWLDMKAPVVAFPKEGCDKIMIGLDLEDFNIFNSDYMKSLEDDMNSGLRMLYLYRDKHRGVFKESQKSILKSIYMLLLFIALIVFDVPYMLVRFLDVVWEMIMPALSLSPDTRILGTPLEAVYIPLIFVMLIYEIFSAWMTITRLHGLPDCKINIAAVLGGLFLSPIYLLMRFMVGADFFQAVREIGSVAAANIDKGTFSIVISVLDIIVNQFFVMMALVICYAGSVICGLSVYLFRNIFKKKKAEEIEEREVVRDIESQWDFYVRFRKELRDADRQLKFMDIWNQSARGNGHFPGWFDINDYVSRAENALLDENRAKIHDLEEEELKSIEGQDSVRKNLMDKVQELKKQEQELAEKSQVTDMDERDEAMVRFAVSMKDRENMDLNTMYDDLAVVLGYKNLWSARRYPEKWQGEKEYAMGLYKEKGGQSYGDVKELYEEGARQGHILALARLSGLYELDYDIKSEIAYGEDIGLQQWDHTLEREAREARLVMGLAPESLAYSLLRRAKKGMDDFDCEMLYDLAVHCQKDDSLKEDFKKLVLLFADIALSRQVKREDSDSARTAYYLAMLNYHCLGDTDGGKMWAEISAEKGYGAAMYFLYENYSELGIARKEGTRYCYQAWETRYPPARVCKIWDHQGEESRKYMEREIQRELNKAQNEEAFRRKQEEKKAMMEAYEKKLKEREKLFNAYVHNSYMDDEGTYLSGKMSADEYLDSSLYHEDKMRDYERKVDRELSQKD